jgi:hypothetical protein
VAWGKVNKHKEIGKDKKRGLQTPRMPETLVKSAT